MRQQNVNQGRFEETESAQIFSGYPHWQTVANAFDTWTTRYADKEAIVFKGERISYEELRENAEQLARGLVRLGVGKGKKVGLWMPNCLEWIYGLFAVAKTGAIIVPINTRYRTFELANILKHAEISTLIFVDKFLNYDCVDMVYELIPEIKNGRRTGKLKRFPSLEHLICNSEKEHAGILNYNEVKNYLSKSVVQTDLDF